MDPLLWRKAFDFNSVRETRTEKATHDEETLRGKSSPTHPALRISLRKLNQTHLNNVAGIGLLRHEISREKEEEKNQPPRADHSG